MLPRGACSVPTLKPFPLHRPFRWSIPKEYGQMAPSFLRITSGSHMPHMRSWMKPDKFATEELFNTGTFRRTRRNYGLSWLRVQLRCFPPLSSATVRVWSNKLSSFFRVSSLHRDGRTTTGGCFSFALSHADADFVGLLSILSGFLRTVSRTYQLTSSRRSLLRSKVLQKNMFGITD